MITLFPAATPPAGTEMEIDVPAPASEFVPRLFTNVMFGQTGGPPPPTQAPALHTSTDVHWLRSADARPPAARVVRGAGVVVAAGIRVVRVRAPGRRAAPVRRAHVPVVAVERRASDAGAVRAGVHRRAGAAVVAGIRVVRVRAPGRRVAPIRRAHISVVAVRTGPVDA